MFFEDPSLLPFFESIIDYLDFDQRVQVLNSRLKVVGDMFTILTEEANAHHMTKLEWIVIVLIIVEVILNLMVLGIDSYTEFFRDPLKH